MILVFTGDGKGKTSAALGTVFRALGHGRRVLVIQFFKGDWPIVFGETVSAKRHKRLEFLQMGAGFVKIMGDKKPMSVHKAAAARALQKAARAILSGRYDLVVLDEIIYALDHQRPTGLISLTQLLTLLRKVPARTDVILTGRNAPERLIRAADLVTRMQNVKHPFEKGIIAKKGIDY